jgi:SAM-dependent methyltransferase
MLLGGPAKWGKISLRQSKNYLLLNNRNISCQNEEIILKTEITCQVCGSLMETECANYTYHCNMCGYWSSNLIPRVESVSEHEFTKSSINNIDTLNHLDAVRVKNFNLIIAQLADYFNSHFSILDIGCGSGLFLSQLQKHGYQGIGIEANPAMAQDAINKGLDVRVGYFPDCLSQMETFDIIIFNDVFEHIPELSQLLIDVESRLHHEGLLVINIPSSSGIIFQVGRIACKYGITSYIWDRLWQKMFYTPHLHYFNETNLTEFMRRNKFRKIARAHDLETVSLQGLWSRISADANSPLLKNLLAYIFAIVAFPFLYFFPKDSFVVFFTPEKLSR